MKEYFTKNRTKLFDRLPEDCAAVFFAGTAPQKGGDENYMFSVNRNFYYLTGCDFEKAILFISSETMAGGRAERHETLYICRGNGPMAKWTGENPTPDEAMEITGIDDIRYIDEFEGEFASHIFRTGLDEVYMDLENRQWHAQPSAAGSFALRLMEKFPYVRALNLAGIMGYLREVKEAYEIERIRRAISITGEGLCEMMKNARPGMAEYELEAYFDFILKKNGVSDKAFQTIVASGRRGTILHYTKNDAIVQDGDLVLVDCGAQYGYYSGDITRTFPVNGRFTPRQRQIYDIVLEGQSIVIGMMRPGQPYDSLNEALKQHYFNRLSEIGLVKERKDVFKYYYHNVGHFLGALTHDTGRARGSILKEGMVITVEPGLYIEEYGIGIRIEDDVLITRDGCEVLSRDIVKSAEDIEAFMAELR